MEKEAEISVNTYRGVTFIIPHMWERVSWKWALKGKVIPIQRGLSTYLKDLSTRVVPKKDRLREEREV
ncbi:MAG: hypothetical protein ACQEQQ_04990 [Chloroflexota bacterium]